MGKAKSKAVKSGIEVMEDGTKIAVNKPLFDQIIPSVDPEKAFGADFSRYRNQNVYCPFCESEGRSKSPSCSVNVDGLFKCNSCGRKGTAVAFYAQKKRIPIQQAKGALVMSEEKAAKWLKNYKPAQPITETLVQKWHTRLMRSTFEMSYLTGAKRGLSLDILKEYEIGCDEHRITIPIRLRNKGLWGVRRYHAGKKPKMVSHAGGNGGPSLYPAWNLDRYQASDQEEVVLCEGEWDCLLLIQNGFDAVTITSGVKTWDDSFTLELLTLGKVVVIIYDVNDVADETGQTDLGQRVAFERACLLQSAGLRVKLVRLPLDYSCGDITDWFTRAKRTRTELAELIRNTPLFDETNPPMEGSNGQETNGKYKVSTVGAETKGKTKAKSTALDMSQPRIVDANDDAPLITLHDASLAKYLYKAIKLRCLVAGRAGAPYLLPTKIHAKITDEDGGSSEIEKSLDPWDGRLLSLIRCSNSAQQKLLRSMMGIDPMEKAAITVVESLNVEEVFLIPAIDHETDQGPYVMRQCYYVGHGLMTNQVYDFEAYTLPDPRSQEATHILTSAKLAATDLENFELSKSQYKQLRDTFQTKDVFAKFEDIAEEFSKHFTHILGRNDLHIAVDLVFHSPLSFIFDGTKVRKGWLDALILGDTRTGKGFVAEGMANHYGVGEMVSAEMVSIAGLLGGISKVGDHNVLTWGKIPLNNKRLVIIDEASNLEVRDIGRMSRIRSEGVLEITKIITDKTSAQTRLIWLSNPRPPIQGKPKVMKEYTFGINAVPELIGNAEDVARFDYVLTVARGEVHSSLINKAKSTDDLHAARYTPELCRKLIVWVWSRKAKDIVFADDVVEYTMKAAHDLGKTFSSSICLIQAEDVRFKLARIACAAAGRTFSTDDGEHLIVRKEHVEFAYNFLHHIYSKPSCGYAQLSLAERERSTLSDPQTVLVCLQQVGDLFSHLVNGLLEQQQISARDMCDYAGVDIYQARSIVSELVRLRAITKDAHFYIKKPAFTSFLQYLKQQMQTNPNHITVADDEDDGADTLEGDSNV